MSRQILELPATELGSSILDRLVNKPNAGETVLVTVEVKSVIDRSNQTTLSDFRGAAKGTYRTPEEAVSLVRNLRDEWQH